METLKTNITRLEIMEQIFKGKKIILKTAVKRILSTYNQSNSFSGSNWYVEANLYAQSLANRFKIPLSVACGVLAALSPIKKWNENKACAYF